MNRMIRCCIDVFNSYLVIARFALLASKVPVLKEIASLQFIPGICLTHYAVISKLHIYIISCLSPRCADIANI
jgi:hypothetical protein